MCFNKIIFSLLLLVLITACESGSNIHYSESEDPIFQVSGRVYGLNGTLELSLNGIETIEMISDDFYRFRTRLKNEQSYSVTVSVQPDEQECVVENSEGVIEYQSMSDVNVYCEDVASKNNVSSDNNLPELKLALNKKQLTFEWPKVAGASNYKVLQWSSRSKSFNAIATDIKQTSYSIDMPQLTYWDRLVYSVFACGKSGCIKATQSSDLNTIIASLENTIELPYTENELSKIKYAISKNKKGDQIFIGAPNDSNSQSTIYDGFVDGLTENSGAVLIYKKIKSKWSLINYLKAPYIDVNDKFGYAIALLNNDKFLAVGSPNDDSSGTDPLYLNLNENSGVVYLYSKKDNFNNMINILKNKDDYEGRSNKYFGNFIDVKQSNDVITVGSTYRKGEQISTRKNNYSYTITSDNKINFKQLEEQSNVTSRVKPSDEVMINTHLCTALNSEDKRYCIWQ